METKVKAYVPTILENDRNSLPDQFIFTMYGDSMKPEIKPDDNVVVNRCNPDMILWGETYLIQTNEHANNMKLVRKLFPHTDHDKIILRSPDQSFPDITLNRSYISGLAIVKGIFSRSQY